MRNHAQIDILGNERKYRMRLARLTNAVWVGDWEACDQNISRFPISVHLWRPNDWHTNLLCSRCRQKTEQGLMVRWREGESLTQLSTPIHELIAYMREPGDLLVHCARGLCRSPHLALVALMARGSDPFDAIRDLSRGLWDDYGVVPHLYPYPLDESISLFHPRPSVPRSAP